MTTEQRGNPSLPSSPEELAKLSAQETGHYTYSVEDFFKKPESSSFQLSPDGRYLSYKKRNQHGKTDIWLQDTTTQESFMLVEEGEDLVRGYGWIDNTHIMYMQDTGGDENYHIYSIDYNDKKIKDLTPFEGVRSHIVNILKDDKDHIIIEMNKDNPQFFEPYLLNIHTGSLKKLYENDSLEEPIVNYIFDKDGTLRGFVRTVGGVDMHVYYFIDGVATKICEVPFGESYWIAGFDYRSDKPDDVFIGTNLNSDKVQLKRTNLRTGEEYETVFSHDVYDVGGMGRSRKRGYEIDYYSYNGEKAHIIPVSDTFKAWYADLEKKLEHMGDVDIYITDETDDEDCLLILVCSDRLVGHYYLYRPQTGELTSLYQLLPQLKAEDMASMHPITFTSRDGLTIHGYLTLPNNPQGKIPLIVNPHGGPQGIRDSWGFNPEVQLFASRGYATLHVNFRISGGYGKSFLQAGFGQVGRKVMDDVEDGIAYVLENYPIDKDKIAIYGGSHGGYAVLRGLTKTPKLYACGVDYVGVSNIYTFMQTMPAYWEPFRKMVERVWYDPNDPSQKEIIDEVSPALNTDKMCKPLFVVQGANDPRVNIDESDQIVTSLRERGIDVPYMVKYDEGHGFGKESNRLDFYRTMMGFLAGYLK